MGRVDDAVEDICHIRPCGVLAVTAYNRLGTVRNRLFLVALPDAAQEFRELFSEQRKMVRTYFLRRVVLPPDSSRTSCTSCGHVVLTNGCHVVGLYMIGARKSAVQSSFSLCIGRPRAHAPI